MIFIDMTLDKAGQLCCCTVEGHAGAGPKGSDIVCAAVSVLARTALRVLSENEGIMVRSNAPERGFFRMELEYRPEEECFLSAVTRFLIEGFDSISTDYPDFCKVRKHMERRQEYGS